MNEHTERPIDQVALSRGHEIREANVSLLVKFGIGLAALAVLSVLLMWAMFKFIDDYEMANLPAPEPLVETNQLPPEPRLQIIPEEDLARLRTEERRYLETYGWVIRTAEIVRIPVDRAMELSIERADRMFPVKPQGSAGQPR